MSEKMTPAFIMEKEAVMEPPEIVEFLETLADEQPPTITEKMLAEEETALNALISAIEKPNDVIDTRDLQTAYEKAFSTTIATQEQNLKSLDDLDKLATNPDVKHTWVVEGVLNRIMERNIEDIMRAAEKGPEYEAKVMKLLLEANAVEGSDVVFETVTANLDTLGTYLEGDNAGEYVKPFIEYVKDVLWDEGDVTPEDKNRCLEIVKNTLHNETIDVDDRASLLYTAVTFSEESRQKTIEDILAEQSDENSAYREVLKTIVAHNHGDSIKRRELLVDIYSQSPEFGRQVITETLQDQYGFTETEAADIQKDWRNNPDKKAQYFRSKSQEMREEVTVLSKNLERMADIENLPGYEGAVKTLHQEFHISNFRRYSAIAMRLQYEQRNDTEIEYGTAVFGDDWNGAHSDMTELTESLALDLKELNPPVALRIIEANGAYSLTKRLIELNERYGRDNEAKFGYFAAHSDEYAMGFGYGRYPKPQARTKVARKAIRSPITQRLTQGDEAPQGRHSKIPNRRIFSAEAPIILSGCHLGKKTLEIFPKIGIKSYAEVVNEETGLETHATKKPDRIDNIKTERDQNGTLKLSPEWRTKGKEVHLEASSDD
jgi:hypothetical protein